MSDTITVTGLVATAPKHIVTSEGLPMSIGLVRSQSSSSSLNAG